MYGHTAVYWWSSEEHIPRGCVCWMQNISIKDRANKQKQIYPASDITAQSDRASKGLQLGNVSNNGSEFQQSWHQRHHLQAFGEASDSIWKVLLWVWQLLLWRQMDSVSFWWQSNGGVKKNSDSKGFVDWIISSVRYKTQLRPRKPTRPRPDTHPCLVVKQQHTGYQGCLHKQ